MTASREEARQGQLKPQVKNLAALAYAAGCG
jgi:hypothetical protein